MAHSTPPHAPSAPRTDSSAISPKTMMPWAASLAPVVAPMLACLLALALALLIGLNLHRGLEWSDEGMYLVSIQQPDRQLSMPSDFGTFFNPIYMALGQDVYALRVLAFSVLLGVGFLLMLCLLALWRRHGALSAKATVAVAAALAAAPLAYYVNWTPTPSYNWLALTGMLTSFSALCLYCLSLRPCHARHGALRVSALLLLGVGGCAAFIGKGTTGAGLGVLALLWMLGCGGQRTWKLRLRDALIPAALALLLLAIYLFGVSHGLGTIKKILLYAQLRDTTYGLSQTLQFYGQYLLPLSYIPVLVAWPLWLGAVWAVYAQRQRTALLLAVITTVYTLVLALVLPTVSIMALCLWPLFGAAVVAAALWRISWRHFGRALLIALACFVGVLVYHAGTNTEVEFKMSETFVLPATAILTMLMAMRRPQRAMLVPVAACVLCCMVWGVLSTSLLKPFRHNGYALWQLTEPVEITPGTRPLLVHAERQAFTRWLREASAESGWQAGTPLLNMSYYTTLGLFLLEGRNVAASWQVEARYTPMESFPKIFGHVSPEMLRKAWILKPVQEGPRHMPLAALALIGLNFPEDYELLGTSPAAAVKGVWPAEHYELWRPREKQEAPAPGGEEKAVTPEGIGMEQGMEQGTPTPM